MVLILTGSTSLVSLGGNEDRRKQMEAGREGGREGGLTLSQQAQGKTVVVRAKKSHKRP